MVLQQARRKKQCSGPIVTKRAEAKQVGHAVTCWDKGTMRRIAANVGKGGPKKTILVGPTMSRHALAFKKMLGESTVQGGKLCHDKGMAVPVQQLQPKIATIVATMQSCMAVRGCDCKAKQRGSSKSGVDAWSLGKTRIVEDELFLFVLTISKFHCCTG